MRLLLDTHAVIWWFLDDPALSRTAHQAIETLSNEVLVSPVSAMEVTTKFRVGKLPQVAKLAHSFEAMVAGYAFAPMPISLAHASLAGSLPFSHKDPFDRLLIAQALVEDIALVSNERIFDQTGVVRIW